MPYEIGFVQNVGVLAHYMMLDKIKTFAEANGYTVLRYNTAIEKRELIMRAPGFSGTEEIYIGFRTYHDVANDYYNMTSAAFTGYVSGNTFETQPGVIMSGIPTHNNRIDYWLTMNAQRIQFALKVGTPVYVTGGAGKFLKYAFNNQYPYPVFCAGMLDGEPATRFSNTAYEMPWKGTRANMRMRFNDGIWKQPACHPWSNTDAFTATKNPRDTKGVYAFEPIIFHDAQGLYGELDGVFFASGFDNVVENTAVIDGDNYVVFQNVSRSGFIDYFAMRLDD